MTDEEIEAMFTPGPPCAQLLGWRLLAHDEARGWIKVGFVGAAEFLNPAGRVQGGILAAMLDDTMGPAVLVKSGGALYRLSGSRSSSGPEHLAPLVSVKQKHHPPGGRGHPAAVIMSVAR